MDGTALNSASPARVPRWFAWLGLLALAVYAALLAPHVSIVAAGTDSSGYLNSARALAAGHLQSPLRAPPGLGPSDAVPLACFQPLGFVTRPDDPLHLQPMYPSGLPLHFALAARLLGWRIGPLVIVLAAVLGALALCYLVARELGLDWWLAAAGSVALGVCPPLLFASVQPLSDTLATTWCLAAVYAALRARRGRGWAVAAGAAFAFAVLVRPTNLVLGPALVVLLGLDWRRLALAVSGGLPGAVWVAGYNHALYGGAFRSGYPDMRDTFGLEFGAPTAWHFARWLACFLPAVLLVLPLAAAARRRTRELLALACWFGAITGVYAFYVVSREDWSCLRFILPAIPAAILAGLLGLDTLLPPFGARRPIAAAVLIAWALGASEHWTTKLGISYIRGYEQAYLDACATARAQFPPSALVICGQASGAVYHHTDFVVFRWDAIAPAAFTPYATQVQKSGRAVCALLYEFEEKPALQEHCPGEWTKVATSDKLSLWRLAAPVK